MLVGQYIGYIVISLDMKNLDLAIRAESFDEAEVQSELPKDCAYSQDDFRISHGLLCRLSWNILIVEVIIRLISSGILV